MLRVLVCWVMMLLILPLASAKELSLRGPGGERFTVDVEGAGSIGVLLIAGESESLQDLLPLQQEFVRAGYTALRMALAGDPQTGQDATEADRARWVPQAQAALRHLLTRTSVDRATVIGSGLGGIVALQAASSEPRVTDAVLVSPLLSSQGQRLSGPFEAWGDRGLLLIAGQDDTSTRRTASALAARAAGPHELHLIDGDRRGAALLSQQPQGPRTILAWMRARQAEAPPRGRVEAPTPAPVETTGQRFGEAP